MLERFFKFKENNTDVRIEVVAGLTTFMTMAYIIFVNPSILEAAGLPRVPTVAATALAAAIPTLLMGFLTNYPFALASGMGLNAVLAYSVVQGQGLSWQTAMGIVFVEGAIITILVLTRVRESVMNAIPMSLKRAIGVGIGLLIAYIGMQQAGWVTGSPATLTSFGSFHKLETVIATGGLVIILVLMARRIRGIGRRANGPHLHRGRRPVPAGGLFRAGGRHSSGGGDRARAQLRAATLTLHPPRCYTSDQGFGGL